MISQQESWMFILRFFVMMLNYVLWWAQKIIEKHTMDIQSKFLFKGKIILKHFSTWISCDYNNLRYQVLTKWFIFLEHYPKWCFIFTAILALSFQRKIFLKFSNQKQKWPLAAMLFVSSNQNEKFCQGFSPYTILALF